MKSVRFTSFHSTNNRLLLHLKSLLTGSSGKLVAILSVALIGSLLLVSTNAATPTASIEIGTNSQVTAPATIVSDNTASGGSAVVFPQPETGGTGGESCAAGEVPGSGDPWGDCWPGPENTGVPDGLALSAYTGPCTVSQPNTVIDAREVNCTLVIMTENVTITRSQINGGVNVPSNAPSNASFNITDSNVAIGQSLNTGLMRRNFVANRVEITGGLRGVYCQRNCTVENTWIHSQASDPGGDTHFSGMRMEQYTTYRHNSITCEAMRGPGTGCSAALTGYPDFAPVRDNLIERNLFYNGGNGGVTMCAYGGATPNKPFSNDPANATNIRFISNRFVRSSSGHCGNLGTILHFNPTRSGNVWTDNIFTDGGVVNATGP